ncbi:MAG: MgtC/SapB family protein [Chloroflexota bacterium]
MDQMFVIRDIDYITIGRVFIAFVLGGLVGFERERTQRPAGLRTHMLVAAGAACFTVASIYGFQGLGVNSDPARLAAQIITGIGFLGAGAIFRTGDTVKGITTASSIWITASIGILIGAGMIYLAIFTTVMTWFVLFVLKSIEVRLERKRRVVRDGEQDMDVSAKS